MPLGNPNLPADTRIRRFFMFYLPLVGLGVAITLYLWGRQSPEFYESLRQFPVILKANKPWHAGLGMAMQHFWTHTLALAAADLKFVFFVTYLFLATTFIPLPTGALVSFAATSRGQFVPSDTGNLLVLAVCGAAASTVANLADYHVFIWMLRHHRIARIRNSRAIQKAQKWFAKAPFTIMLIFNIIHIPVDVVRMLAAIHGYKRTSFAASNFLGRFVRYATIGLITLLLGEKYDWIGPLAFLALAAAIGLSKVIPALWRRWARPAA